MSLSLSASTLFPVQPVAWPAFEAAGISVSILRLDLLHPQVSGNKWFKLIYNLQAAKERGSKTLVSFGGAWSNHLHALAWAARENGFKSVGFIRGELPDPLNACLRDASERGMQLIPLTRESYRNRAEPEYIVQLLGEIDGPFLIPEGGANAEGIRGCSEILNDLAQQDFDLLALACGTGTTMAGLLMRTRIPVLGIQVLKGEAYLQQEVARLLLQNNILPAVNWRVNDSFHRGGYARTDADLLAFCSEFEVATGVPLEPVYTGKLLLALQALIRSGEIARGTRLAVVHGGGLQGKRGFK